MKVDGSLLVDDPADAGPAAQRLEAAGYEVYNCNPDSKLTAFDYVPLERAQQIARGLVPAEPWPDDMLLGWYAKDEDPENRKAD